MIGRITSPVRGDANHHLGATTEMKPLRAISIAAATTAALAAAQPASADAVAEFYKGRNVTIVVGFSAGGGMDLYARLLGRHLGDHLPGKPNVIVQNMPGGGGLTAANYIANAAPQDGSYIIIMLPTNAIEPVMGNKNARWDTSKLHWLGTMAQDAPSCAASGRSGLKSIEDARDREIIFGATGPSSTTAQQPYALANIFGYKVKVISGYAGTLQVWDAMEKGEVEAVCSFWASHALGQQKENIDSGKLVPIIQFGMKKHPVFGDAPLVHDLARNDEERKLTQFIFGLTEISRPVAAPPGVPADRVAALREGFWQTMTSPGLKAEAERTRMIVNAADWRDTEASLKAILEMPKEIIDRAKEAIRN